MCEEGEEWTLEFDGSSLAKTGGAGVTLFNEKEKLLFSFKLDFPCSNNEAEDEALTLGLMEALEWGITRLCINGDSNVVVKQLNRDYEVKHIHLVPYRAIIQKLYESFRSTRILK